MDSVYRRPTIIAVLTRWFHILLLLSICGGVLIALLIDQASLAIVGFTLVGPPILAASVFAYKHRKLPYVFKYPDNIEREYSSILFKSFLIAFMFSIISLTLSETRPWLYFAIMIGVFGIISLQIFVLKKHHKWILVAIASSLLNIIYGITLKYPLYFGWTDILSHLRYATIIYESGSLLPSDIIHYSDFPLYHIYIAQGSYILGVDISLSLYLITGVAFTSTLGFVFAIVHTIKRDKTLALIASLFFTLQPLVIFYGAYMVTRTMAFVASLMIIYVVLKFQDYRGEILLLIMALFITLVHQVSIVQFGALLCLLFSIDLVYNSLQPNRATQTDSSIVTPIQFIVIMLVPVAYWVFASGDIINFVISNYLLVATGSEGAIGESVGQTSHHMTYYINTYIMIFLSLCGIYTVLSSNYGRKSITIALFALITSILYFPSPLTTLPAAETLAFNRFALFLSPIFAYVMAEGMLSISQLWDYNLSQTFSTSIIIFLIFVVAFSGTAMTASSGVQNAADVDEFSWTGPPLHFTNQEIAGIESITNLPLQDNSIYSDWQTVRYLRGVGGMENEYSTVYLESETQPFPEESYIILRESRTDDGLLLGGDGDRYNYEGQKLKQRVSEGDKMYHNGDIGGYKT